MKRMLLALLLLLPATGFSAWTEKEAAERVDWKKVVFSVGGGTASLSTNYWDVYPGAVAMNAIFRRPVRASNLVTLNFGMEYEMLAFIQSHIDIRTSPWLGGNADCFYLEAAVGYLMSMVTLITGKKGPFDTLAGFDFYATMLSFNSPLVQSNENFSRTYLEKSNGGLGVITAGLTVRFEASLFLFDRLRVSGGLYSEFGSILPGYFALGLGFTGPNVSLELLPEKLWLYVNCRLVNFVYDMSVIDAGLKLRL